MYNRVRKFFKEFDEKVLKKEVEQPQVNFKGQRFAQFSIRHPLNFL